jgi:hypothetical protein
MIGGFKGYGIEAGGIGTGEALAYVLIAVTVIALAGWGLSQLTGRDR